MLADPEIARVLWVEQVADLLVVDFDVGDFYGETNVGVRLLLLDPREQLGTCERYNTLVGAICERGPLREECGGPNAVTYNPSYCTGMISVMGCILKKKSGETCL